MFKEQRPNIRTEMTSLHKLANIIGIASILVGVILLILFWSDMPDTVPTHFNIQGEPDGWGSKNSLILLPILATFLFVLLSFIEKRPQSFNYLIKITEENAYKQYTLARSMMNLTKNISTLLLMVISCYSILDANETTANGLYLVISAIVVLLFIVMIWYISKSVKHK